MARLLKGNATICDMEDFTESGSITDIISFIMHKETDIAFESFSASEEGYKCVLFTACFPWRLNDIEKGLTYDSLIEIIRPYADELGIDYVGDHTLTYGG